MDAVSCTTVRANALPGSGSDEDLRTAALEALRLSGYLTLRGLECAVAEGVVTLSGRVHTFHLKQVAQAVLLKAAPFRSVRNAVEVCPRQGGPWE